MAAPPAAAVIVVALPSPGHAAARLQRIMTVESYAVGQLTDHSLSPERFGAAFKTFLDTVVASAGPPASPLLERIRAHLGTGPAQLPVVAEEFDSFAHPNVQVALDAYLAGGQRQATLLGVAAENKRFAPLSLSDLLVRTSALVAARVGRP
jgi:hypothetical protein